MLKDRFTVLELAEFTIGAFISVFLGLNAIDALSRRVELWQAIIVLLFTLFCAISILWIRHMEKPLLRVFTALVVASVVSFVFFVFILGLSLFVYQNLVTFLIGVSSCTIGALTIDILRED